MAKKDFFYTWNTTKVSNGFKFNVLKIIPRKTPNKIGHYADTKIVKTGILPTRARAKALAQKWMRYYTKLNK